MAAESQLVSPEHLMKLYQDHMAMVEQKCVDNLKELLLERSDLFAQAESANILERVDLGLTVRGGGCEGVNDCVMTGGCMREKLPTWEQNHLDCIFCNNCVTGTWAIHVIVQALHLFSRPFSKNFVFQVV